MTGKTKGTKVFTHLGREFEIADEYMTFRSRFINAKDTGAAIVTATLLDGPISFPIDAIVAFIPMIDLTGGPPPSPGKSQVGP